MKIVYCIPTIWIVGGLERVTILKANYLAEHYGYDVTIITTDQMGKAPYYPHSDKIKLVDLDINLLHVYFYSFPRRIVTFLYKMMIYKRRLRKTLIGLKPDIVISLMDKEVHFINSIQDGSIKIAESHNTKDFRDRILLEQQTRPWDNLITRIRTKWIENDLRKFNKLVLLTDEDFEDWKTSLSNLHVIPNPNTFNSDSVSTCLNKEVISVGRLTYQKGFDLLIQAWKIVNQTRPDWKLSIYGEGELRDTLSALIVKLQLSDTITLHPACTDIKSKYLNSSIYVLSSRFEGFGMVLIEAMSCGLPVVSFSCKSGPRDIIRDNEDGYLVENGNIELLADKFIDLIAHDDLRIRMGAKAKENVERYNIDNVMKEWNKLFLSLISSKQIID